MEQAIQILGAVLILTAFVAIQRGAMRPNQLVYIVLNLVGAAILAVVAALDSDWGFLLLEAVWALVSAQALLTLVRGRRPLSMW